MEKEMECLILNILKPFRKKNFPYEDSLRGVVRPDMSGQLVETFLALHKLNGKYTNNIRDGLDFIIKTQHESGYWPEYSYRINAEKVSFWGTMPTAFCVIALIHAYNLFKKDKKYLNAAIKGCDFIYSKERRGYFIKSKINKADALNTDLLCGLALIELSEIVRDERSKLYYFAGIRSIYHCLESQLPNGGYPYAYLGFTLPITYHAFTMGLLIRLYDFVKDPLILCSIMKAAKWLSKMQADDGTFKWDKENFHEKSGASWAYAWALYCWNKLSSVLRSQNIAKTKKHLDSMLKDGFLISSDFLRKEDSLNACLSLLPLSWSILFPKRIKNPSKSDKLKSSIRWTLIVTSKIPNRLWLAWRIIQRRYISHGMGAIEHW